ncbi:hypothetical protein Anapl_07161 [Anas platyrhynchos]|uniref:Maestro/Maestro-like HEAT-repeats domain-containing protein n=1 Tax=Anas platyrhynchos TaxID=8839 RepID=R0LD74_ANAPL|nr:hypothetical protein Anapl_07161 [Anas platyrhynchos]
MLSKKKQQVFLAKWKCGRAGALCKRVPSFSWQTGLQWEHTYASAGGLLKAGFGPWPLAEQRLTDRAVKGDLLADLWLLAILGADRANLRLLLHPGFGCQDGPANDYKNQEKANCSEKLIQKVAGNGHTGAGKKLELREADQRTQLPLAGKQLHIMGTHTSLETKTVLVTLQLILLINNWPVYEPEIWDQTEVKASSQVREHSICLFQAMVEDVLRQRKKEMKRTVHRSLLPLYFHMRDQSESVAKWQSRGLALATEPSARCPSHGCTRVRQHPGVSPKRSRGSDPQCRCTAVTDRAGAQGLRGVPEHSPRPTMPQPPARRSRRFLSENSPTPEAASEGDEEGGMPPRQPRLAWQETWSSRGSNRPAEDSLLAVERTPVEAFLPEEDSSPADAIAQAAGSSQVEESQDDVQWLDPSKAWKLCRDKAVEFIRAYVRGTEKVMAAACITAVLLALPSRGPTQPQTPQGFGPAGRGCPPNALLVSLWLPGRRGAEDAVPQQNLRSVHMCHREGKHKLVENIMVRGCAAGWGRGKAPRHQPPGRRGLGQRWLCCCWVPAAPRSHPACALQALLEKEPMDSLRTAFRQKAMETVALLSNTIPTALCGKKESLLNMCCKSIFFLPPESDVPETGVLYAKRLGMEIQVFNEFVKHCLCLVLPRAGKECLELSDVERCPVPPQLSPEDSDTPREKIEASIHNYFREHEGKKSLKAEEKSLKFV